MPRRSRPSLTRINKRFKYFRIVRRPQYRIQRPRIHWKFKMWKLNTKESYKKYIGSMASSRNKSGRRHWLK
jgi:hypothetical protein